MKKHNFYLVPKEKIIMGGPMNIFIRCKNKGCAAGIDWCSLEDPQVLLKQANEKLNKGKCPFNLRGKCPFDGMEEGKEKND